MKPKVIKNYENLSEEIQERIKLFYPNGFSENLIRFTDKEGKIVSALPFEDDEKYYLIRMTNAQAFKIISDDVDYDEEGHLKDDVKDDYEEKYTDLDTMKIGQKQSSDDIDDDYD